MITWQIEYASVKIIQYIGEDEGSYATWAG